MRGETIRVAPVLVSPRAPLPGHARKYGAYVRLVRGDDMVFCYSYGRFELLDFNMRHGTSYDRCVAA